MLITACLTMFVVWSLLIGSVPTTVLVVICAASSAFFLVFGRHSHGTVLTIDVYARRSRFAPLNASEKVLTSVLLLVLCICAQSPWPPLCLFLVMSSLTVFVGKLHVHDYLALLSLPAVFLLLSGIALIWDYSAAGSSVFSVPLFHGYLIITQNAQQTARLVMSRAFGAVSCLYFLSLSTPMPEILTVLRKAHVPAIVIDLSILIYRYIFVLLLTYRNMNDAAASRLGYDGFHRSLHTTGTVYGNLLARSFRRANACFDAMESRCYTGQIRFLEQHKPITRTSALGFVCLIALMTASVLSTYL